MNGWMDEWTNGWMQYTQYDIYNSFNNSYNKMRVSGQQ